MNTSLHVEAGTTAVTPGTPVPVPVRVRNTGDVTMQVVVRLVGVEDDWAGPPMMVGPLAPGEAADVEFPVRIPVGFPACDHLAGVEAEPIDPTNGAPIGRPIFTEVVLEIGDGSEIRANLEPADIHGGGRAKFRIALRNRSRHPLNVRLEAESPGDILQVRFDEDDLVLPPGEFVNVRARVRGARPLMGPARRLPFVVTIRSRGTPRHLDGSFTQTATLKSGFMKVIAVVAVVAMWGSLLVLGLGKINPPKRNNVAAPAGATQSGSNSDQSSDSNGGGGSGGGGGANGGGSGGGGSGNGGGGGGNDTAAPTGPNEIKVGGKVKASDPSGVTVSIQQTSLVDEDAQGATFVNGAPSTALTMHYGHTGITAPSLVAPLRTTQTDADGSWSFGGVKAPGFYLLIFSKPGFGTQKFVVTAPDDGSPIVLDADLIAGDGAIAGTISDANGPLGGVDLTITDGTVTLKTLTPTSGNIGKWGVTGLTTPGTYLITATRNGYGDETKLVELKAGDSVGDADIVMHAGVGSIHGTVTSIDGPVGDAKVSVTDGKTENSVTTLTVDPKGTYNIPQLPIPGQYTLTVSADGWITQTQHVDLTGNPTIDVLLTASGGTLSGIVRDRSGTPPLPDPLPTLDGVGITISNEKVTLKTTSATGASGSPGLYVQKGIPPGNYKVTFEKDGYVSESSVVDIAAGELKDLPMTMDAADPASTTLTSTVSITARSLKDLALLSNEPVSDPDQKVHISYDEIDPLNADPNTNTTTHTLPTVGGVATFTGVSPGLHTFTATATHFKTTDVTVIVPPAVNEIPINATVLLPQNAIVTGILTDVATHPITDAGMQVVAHPPAGRSGLVDVQANVAADGRYTFDGTLEEGTWSLVASGSDFVANDGLSGHSPPVLVTVFAAQTIEQPITLHRKGRIQAVIKTLNQAGSAIDLTGAVVHVTGPTNPSDETVGTDDLLFTGLTAGTYTVQITSPSAISRTLNTAIVTDDNTTTSSVTYGGLEVKVPTVDGGGNQINGPAFHVAISGPTTPAAQDVTSGDEAFFGTLKPGTYSVTVSNATGATLTFSQTFNATVSDNNVTRVSRVLGRLEVAVQAPNVTTGVLGNSGGKTVTLKQGGTTKATATSSSDGPTVFTGLDATTYTVEVSGTTQVLTATISNGAVTRVGLVLAVAPVNHLTGAVVWNVDGATQPITGATVSVVGITDYTFTTLPVAPFFSFSVVNGTQTATTDAAGRFDVNTTGFKFSSGNVTVSKSDFITRPVNNGTDPQLTNVDIDGPLAASACPSSVTTGHTDLANACVVLTGIPGTLNGTVTLVGAHGDTPNAVVTAQITQPLATGISVSVSSAGALVVSDPTVAGTNAIRPGTFTIAFSAPGYDVTSLTSQPFTINPNQTTNVNVTLTKRASLPINVFCRNTIASGVTETSATVRLTQGTSPTFTFDQTRTGRSPLTFTNLLPGTYNTQISAPGCETDTTNTYTLAAGDTTAQNVQLTKLAQVSGQVVSKLTESSTGTTGVPGLTITLTGSTQPAVSTTTDNNGNFVFGDLIGIPDDVDYQLAIDPFPTSAYTLSTTNPALDPFDVTGHTDVTGKTIVLIAKRATMHGTIHNGASNGPTVQGVTITATTSQVPPSGRTVQVTTNADGEFFFDAGSGSGHASDLEPVLWNFNYSLTDFNPLGEQITLTPGADLLHDVVITEQRNTIQGITRTKFGSATAVAENGVLVTVTKVTDSNDVHTTTSPTDSSGATGNWSVANLKNGSYFVKFSKSGFADQTDQVTVSNGQVLVHDGTINATPATTVTVNVKSAVTNAGPSGASVPIFISGATVTLTPKTTSPAQRSPDTYTATTLSDGNASFTQVLPSTYTIAVTNVSPHLLNQQDITEFTIAVGDTTKSQNIVIQEARVMGRVFVQDSTTTPTSGTSGIDISMYTGQTATGTPVTFQTGSDTTENAININWLRYVPASSTGYTFVFSDDSDHETVTRSITDPSAATNKTVNVGAITLRKFATLNVTLSASGTITNGEAELQQTNGTTLQGPITCQTTCSFTVLPGNYKVHGTGTVTVTTPSSGSSSSSSSSSSASGTVTVSNVDPGETRAVSVTIS